jgi:hypothetical protein
VPGYGLFDARWPFLFNSYYEGEGERHARVRRGMISRPALDEVYAYRAHVDRALVEALPGLAPAVRDLVELGLNHEEQHQELMLMDMLATFAENPLLARPSGRRGPRLLLRWSDGMDDRADGRGRDRPFGGGFASTARGRGTRLCSAPHALADRLVTNGEWLRFIEEGGYSRPELWLSDGWAWVCENRIDAPLYWRGAKRVDALRARRAEAGRACRAGLSHQLLRGRCLRALGRGAASDGGGVGNGCIGARSRSGNQLDEAGPVRPQPRRHQGCSRCSAMCGNGR